MRAALVQGGPAGWAPQDGENRANDFVLIEGGGLRKDDIDNERGRVSAPDKR